jgi:hypothetical protein
VELDDVVEVVVVDEQGHNVVVVVDEVVELDVVDEVGFSVVVVVELDVDVVVLVVPQLSESLVHVLLEAFQIHRHVPEHGVGV